jgi:multicomponent Na+:H+ antiporter subunit E
MFGLHFALAVGLAAFAGQLSPLAVLGSFALVHLVLRLAAPITGTWRYVRQVELGCQFLFWFVAEVLRASVQVARLVLGTRVDISPAVLSYPLERPGDRMGTILGCLLTLTPGTLALDYHRASGCLQIHALNARPAAAVLADIRAIELRLLAWLDAGQRPAAERKIA